MPSLLDRYILRLFFLRLGLALAVLLSLYLSIDVFEKLRWITRDGLSPADFAHIVWFRIPLALSHLLPMACLLASLFTITTLNRRQELTALRATGTSPARALLPLLFGALLTGLALWCLLERWLPPAAQRLATLEPVGSPTRHALSDAAPRWWVVGNHALRVSSIPAEGQLEGLEMLALDPSGAPRAHLLAHHATWNGQSWIAFDVRLWSFSPDGSVHLERLTERKLELNVPPRALTPSSRAPEALPYGALLEMAALGRLTGQPVEGLETASRLRLLMPMACVLLVLMGGPSSVRFARDETLVRAAGRVLVIAVFYALMTGGGLLLVQRQAVTALWGVWLPQAVWFSMGSARLIRLA